MALDIERDYTNIKKKLDEVCYECKTLFTVHALVTIIGCTKYTT